MGALSNYAEDKCLDVFGHTSFSVTATYVKLHVGSPGEDCTANPATEVTRKEATWEDAADGEMTTNDDVVWEDVAADETYTHVSLWDDDEAGNPLWYGPITPNKVVNDGDTFTIAAGELTLSLD